MAKLQNVEGRSQTANQHRLEDKSLIDRHKGKAFPTMTQAKLINQELIGSEKSNMSKLSSLRSFDRKNRLLQR